MVARASSTPASSIDCSAAAIARSNRASSSSMSLQSFKARNSSVIARVARLLPSRSACCRVTPHRRAAAQPGEPALSVVVGQPAWSVDRSLKTRPGPKSIRVGKLSLPRVEEMDLVGLIRHPGLLQLDVAVACAQRYLEFIHEASRVPQERPRLVGVADQGKASLGLLDLVPSEPHPSRVGLATSPHARAATGCSSRAISGWSHSRWLSTNAVAISARAFRLLNLERAGRLTCPPHARSHRRCRTPRPKVRHLRPTAVARAIRRTQRPQPGSKRMPQAHPRGQHILKHEEAQRRSSRSLLIAAGCRQDTPVACCLLAIRRGCGRRRLRVLSRNAQRPSPRSGRGRLDGWG